MRHPPPLPFPMRVPLPYPPLPFPMRVPLPYPPLPFPMRVPLPYPSSPPSMKAPSEAPWLRPSLSALHAPRCHAGPRDPASSPQARTRFKEEHVLPEIVRREKERPMRQSR